MYLFTLWKILAKNRRLSSLWLKSQDYRIPYCKASLTKHSKVKLFTSVKPSKNLKCNVAYIEIEQMTQQSEKPNVCLVRDNSFLVSYKKYCYYFRLKEFFNKLYRVKKIVNIGRFDYSCSILKGYFALLSLCSNSRLKKDKKLMIN